MNKTYYFSNKEVVQALSDYVYKQTNEQEYVHPDDFTLQCLDDNDKDVDFRVVSIFNEDYKYNKC